MSHPFFGTLKYKKLHPRAKALTRAHETDAGQDICAIQDYVVPAGAIRVVSTGISLQLPPHTYGRIADRSSMAAKGWRVGGGVIDASYSGEVGVVLQNVTAESMTILAGQKIAQVVVTPVYELELEEVQELGGGERKDRGFGSSGL